MLKQNEEIEFHGELQLKALGYRHWSEDKKYEESEKHREQHRAQTPKGSFVLGVLHDYKKTRTKRFIDEYAVPEIIRRAKRAISEKKKVWFIAEGDIHGVRGSEQEVIAQAVDNATNGKVFHDTWDDEEVIWHITQPINKSVSTSKQVNQINTSSPAFQKMVKIFKNPNIVEAGLYAMMAGQGEKISLKLGVRNLLKKLNINPNDQKQLYGIAFGFEYNDEQNVLREITEMYNRLRQENLLRKIRKIENKDGIALVTAGGSHVFSLKPVLEQFNKVFT